MIFETQDGNNENQQSIENQKGEQQLTNRNGHPRECDCDECKILIEEIFKAFKITPFNSPKGGGAANREIIPCPKCGRPTWAANKGAWLVWSCWCSNFTEAVITTIKNDYGFAEAPNIPKIYFHFARRHTIVCRGADWLDIFKPLPDSNLVMPQIGQAIIYQEFKGERGIKALWWALYSEYIAAQNELANRPLFRFVERVGRINLDPRYRILWEGKNIIELKSKFRIDRFPCYDIGNTARGFILLNPDNNEWIDSEDPREWF